jgi:signal transduction histidine kinase
MSVQDDPVAALREELRLAKEEIEIQQWGIAKTNEALKAIYKELKNKNEELQKLSDLKSSFVYGLTHELRMPLAMMREGISQLTENVVAPLPPGLLHPLSIALKNIDRLQRIIDNMLEMAKLEAGKTELKLEEADLVALAKQAVADCAAMAGKKGVELKERFSSDSIILTVDKDKMTQVLINLMGNALKFTNAGYIEVGITDEGERVTCYVADSGLGISKEDLGKVFGRFQQFKSAQSVSQKGTGLGLSIVKDIITLHGGSIWVESEPGKGTKFIFTIPRVTGEKAE